MWLEEILDNGKRLSNARHLVGRQTEEGRGEIERYHEETDPAKTCTQDSNAVNYLMLIMEFYTLNICQAININFCDWWQFTTPISRLLRAQKTLTTRLLSAPFRQHCISSSNDKTSVNDEQKNQISQ